MLGVFNRDVPYQQISPHAEASTSSRAPISTYVYILVVSVCLGEFLFGYDTGVISGALQPLQDEFGLTVFQKELVVAGTTLGAILGGPFAGNLADSFGRKPVIYFGSLLFVVGSVILAWASQFTTLLIGRIVVGMGVGFASMITPLYTSEVAPKTMRGQLLTINILAVTFGQVVAYIVNMIFAGFDDGWRLMFGIAALPAISQLFLLPFVPESPRYSVAAGKEAAAKQTLRKIYGPVVSEDFVESEISKVEEDLKLGRDGKYSDLLKKENLVPLLVACFLQAAQQLSGFNSAMYYAATILRMAGFRSNESSTNVAILVAITNMIFTAVAIAVIDRVGRRRMLITTMFFMILGLFALGSSFAARQGFIPKQDTCEAYASNCASCVLDERCGWLISKDQCGLREDNAGDIYSSPTGCPPFKNETTLTVGLLLSLILYIASFALGLGYVPWIIQSELFTISVRAKANGISTAVNWICNLFVSITFLSMTELLSPAGTFYLYALISIVFWIFSIRWVPETGKKSLEEARMYFRRDTERADE